MIYRSKILDTIVTDFIDSGIIKANDTLLVALSGGPDSMCLLDAFYKLSVDFKYNLKAIHVHHGIRGKEADNDLQFVDKYCKSFSIPLIKKFVKAKEYADEKGLTLEESARTLRYKAFDEEWIKHSDKKNNTYILVAHHMKDLAETVIHNMSRGTGIKGLVGIKKVSSYVLRPLLYITKDEIEAYIDEYAIPYVIDSTNKDENYTRNFIRREIVDNISKVNDKAIEHIAELSKQVFEINDYLETLSKSVLNKIITKESLNSITINLKLFRNTSHIIEVYIIREIFNRLVSTLKDITKVNIEDIIELSKKEKGGHLDLPYNITIDKKQNDLIFTHNVHNVSMSKRRKK